MTIQILKQTEKAKLITDGKNTTWIKSAWMREDGSLTPAAIKSLENGQPLLSKEEYAAKMEAAKWVSRPLANFILSPSGKAYGIKVHVYENMSEQSISRMMWFPASQAKIEGETIILPTWLVNAKIEETKESCATGNFKTSWMEIEF